MADKKTAKESKPTPIDFEVTVAREIDGQWRNVGDRVKMFAEQAKYYLPPLGSGLKPAVASGVKAKPEPEKGAAKSAKADT